MPIVCALFTITTSSDRSDVNDRTRCERSILERARRGDTDAFDLLFHTNKDRIYAILWHLLDGDKSLVEEAVGDVFLSAYRGLRKFRGEASLSTWLHRIAVNEAFRLRRLRRFKLEELSEENLSYAAGADPDPVDQMMRNAEGRTLLLAVRALPEPYRTPVTLRYFSGLAASEVAIILCRPPGTVRYQVKRGLELLRERLGDEWDR